MFEILLSVLAVITGFFGMNVPLPLMNDRKAWMLICAVSALIWIALTWIMRWIIKRR
nr:CorA family divalent cation transporter [Oribacterium parvum]